MDRANALRRIGLFLGLGFWFFLLVSLASFHVDDWPAHHVYPHQPVENLCGQVGAFFAYWCYVMLGQGVYLVLLFSGVCIAMALVRSKISDLWLRIVGLALVSVAFAATLNNFYPGSRYSFPEGNGGWLGIATSFFLQTHFNKVGSLIMLMLTLAVGMVLVADELVVRAMGLAGKAALAAKERAKGMSLPTIKMPDLAGKFRSAAPTSEMETPETADTLPAAPAGNVFTPQTPRPLMTKSKLPSSFDGLARIINDDDDLVKRPVLLERNKEDMAAEKIQATPSDLAVAPVPDAGAPEMQFTYEHDQPAEPTAPVEDAAHVDADDPPPAAVAVVPPPEEQVVKPAEPVKTELVVRMPGVIAPRRTSPALAPAPKELGDYHLPGWNLLIDADHGYAESQEKFVREKAGVLEQALHEFGIDAHVVETSTGPVITLYEISMAPGTKVSQITSLENDIARALAATSVRIVAPVPGKNTVGIEVPNAQKEKVRIKELMQLTSQETQDKQYIPLFLGKDANGEPLVADLAAMPHCLIAGTTGSGKSVCINSIIMSIMYTQRPDHVKLVLFDPKIVEMAAFKEIPHLMCPIINESSKAAGVLEWACEKMDERYEMLAEAGVRNIAGYNKLSREELFERFQATNEEEQARIPKHLPYVVIIIDELADLMMTSGKEVEASIVRLAQKARAVGIHLILATQRPQATVVTGLIKANMPCKIAFRVASKMDSRIVLDQNGADLLLGQGDMLFLAGGAGKPIRSQGTFIDDKEVRDSVKLVSSMAQAQYEPELVQIKSAIGAGEDGMVQDDLFDEAVRIVLETKRGSVSLLQRRLNIGYGRASRLIEMMAQSGLLGDYKGSQAREVTISLDEWDAMKKQQQTDADNGMTV